MTSYISQQLYASIDQQLVDNLPKVYRVDIVFRDPMQRIEGLDDLTHYFAGMLAGLEECHFELAQVTESNSLVETSVVKTAHLRHYAFRRFYFGQCTTAAQDWRVGNYWLLPAIPTLNSKTKCFISAIILMWARCFMSIYQLWDLLSNRSKAHGDLNESPGVAAQ